MQAMRCVVFEYGDGLLTMPCALFQKAAGDNYSDVTVDSVCVTYVFCSVVFGRGGRVRRRYAVRYVSAAGQAATRVYSIRWRRAAWARVGVFGVPEVCWSREP